MHYKIWSKLVCICVATSFSLIIWLALLDLTLSKSSFLSICHFLFFTHSLLQNLSTFLSVCWIHVNNVYLLKLISSFTIKQTKHMVKYSLHIIISHKNTIKPTCHNFQLQYFTFILGIYHSCLCHALTKHACSKVKSHMQWVSNDKSELRHLA